ncbi:HAMP domain-containing histidine kinase [Bartonella sp. HY329]|uniref:sensor histidine kinase n=1 Tax=unclassified Bartonella TaxID=2645622 RepID=UPI0021C95BE6|nr:MULTISPECIES: HAMP domain-containing sensor histidine kinase [unclassified Bartonella]UXM95172.1 HAMP domain-containing histidine kinase [Bartonella sp. HY329]UXN09495.1 HAMP domain-containing histidine kinase [Bartonella sp. HY328]
MILNTNETATIDINMSSQKKSASQVASLNFHAAHENKIPFFSRIRTRLLLLMVLSVLITEILAFIPSIANMQSRWLENQTKSAMALSYVLLNEERIVLDHELQHRVLSATKALALTVTRDDGSIVAIRLNGQEYSIDQNIDLNKYSETELVISGLTTLFSNTPKIIRLFARTDDNNQVFSMTFTNSELREEMLRFTWKFAIISLTIAIVATTIIYLIVYELLVRPLRAIYLHMLDFVAEPENPNRIIVPEKRRDEMGVAQRRLADIEVELQQNYVRQKHLANLGLAVSKINHDMRNILASAQLISDHLAEVNDPLSKRLTPKLIHTIDRAINYTQSIMAYGRMQEQRPNLQLLSLHGLVNDIKENLAISGRELVNIHNKVPEDFEMLVDSEQLNRILTNLFRNAVQAMTSPAEMEKDKSRDITVSAYYENKSAILDIIDNGPGLPAKAKEHLFTPFDSSTGHGGTGLGLAICLELVRAHGGTIELVDDGEPGTHFRIRIPMAMDNLSKWYGAKKTA